MKKNITINLCGRLFNIDEDAYELLHNYMETLRNYFKRQEGGEEIADDIEERIAELLDELKASGVEAVNIDHVKDIINRVGQPEQMEGDAESADGNSANADGNTNQQSAYHQPYGHKGIEGVKEFFKTHRTGYFVAPRDSLAAAIVNAAQESGLRIPEDVQVLAEIGSKYSYIVRPQVSSFSIDMFKVGSIAVRMLTKLLNEPEGVKQKTFKIRATFNKRETTK